VVLTGESATKQRHPTEKRGFGVCEGIGAWGGLSGGIGGQEELTKGKGTNKRGRILG